jgi:hypothetical protein
MPTPTYTPLANITLGSAASSIVFGSIPATYRDLVVVLTGNGSTNLEGRLRLNGDSSSDYFTQRLSGSGSAASAAEVGSQTSAVISSVAKATTTSALQIQINILGYRTGRNKIIISRADNSANGTEALAGRWGNNAAVTSVTILTSTGNWAAGTTAALYGIVA